MHLTSIKQRIAMGFAVLLLLGLAPLPGQAASGALDHVQAAGPSEAAALDALAAAIAAFDRDLGIVRDPAPAVLGASLAPEVAAGLAHVLEGMRVCARLVAPEEVRALWSAPGADPAAPWAPAMKACGEDVALRLEALSAVLDAVPLASSGGIDLWPILYYEPAGVDNEHVHDYLLLVDKGGDDAYYNNAGGTVIDVMRGPAPYALSNDPARGCQTDAELNTASGNCILAGAAVLLDKAGRDTYGRLESPQADAVCTGSPLVRRLATGGSGVAGVGILVDEAGDDTYLGKTLALGMGHSGGFGLLRDLAGDDSYAAIRSSIGAGVLVGLGTLDERAGNDVYGVYDPAGGVIDNNGVCRAGNANTLGAGLIAAVGVLHDHKGADSYTAGANSAGSGSLAGVGVFLDDKGDDAYAVPAGGRDDHVTLVGPTETAGFGVFVDG